MKLESSKIKGIIFICLMVISFDTIPKHIDGMRKMGQLRLKHEERVNRE